MFAENSKVIFFCFFVFLIVFLVVVILNENEYASCSSSVLPFSQVKSSSREYFQRLLSQIDENEFIIPENDRKPKEDIKEFYKNQDQKLFNQLITTRSKYVNQHHVGSVIKDGFNTNLPENYMWKNSKIETGKHVEKLKKDVIQDLSKNMTPPTH